MPRLLENGRPTADPYIALGDTDEIPATGPVLVGLERWRADGIRLAARGFPLGVRLKSHQLAREIAPDLGRLALIAVEFPKFRDGRGFSTARELRERHGFTGEIRAVGHLLPDQYLFLLRAGFSRVEIPDDADPDIWSDALGRITIAYQPAPCQPAAASEGPLSLLRRHLRVTEAS